MFSVLSVEFLFRAVVWFFCVCGGLRVVTMIIKLMVLIIRDSYLAVTFIALV